tara:strand:- start:55 stop:213 length:159 start_codon:yes stop_codon:yes gene_type:complete
MDHDGEVFGLYTYFFGLCCCDDAVLYEVFFNFVNETFSFHGEFPLQKAPRLN